MTKIFGIPAGGLTVVLAIVLALALAAVAALAVRNRVFFRLGVRNLKRRRGRTVLIVTGLMLGTTIISAALASGNSGTGGDYFPQRDAVRIAHGLARSDAIDGVAPVITEPVAVQDVESRQTEPRVTLFAAA